MDVFFCEDGLNQTIDARPAVQMAPCNSDMLLLPCSFGSALMVTGRQHLPPCFLQELQHVISDHVVVRLSKQAIFQAETAGQAADSLQMAQVLRHTTASF